MSAAAETTIADRQLRLTRHSALWPPPALRQAAEMFVFNRTSNNSSRTENISAVSKLRSVFTVLASYYIRILSTTTMQLGSALLHNNSMHVRECEQ